MGDLARPGAGADADDHGAAALDGDEQHMDGGRIAMPNRDPVTPDDPATRQLLRQRGRRGVEFTPRQNGAGMVDVGHPVGR